MNKNLVFIEAMTIEAADAIKDNSSLYAAFRTAVFTHGGNVMPFPNAEFSFFTTVSNFEKIAKAGVFDKTIVDAFTKANARMQHAIASGAADLEREEIEDDIYGCIIEPIADMKDVRVAIKKKF